MSGPEGVDGEQPLLVGPVRRDGDRPPLGVGAQVRVIMGRSECAMVGYWDARKKDYRLVDPTRTVYSSRLAPICCAASNCGVDFRIKARAFVEVRMRTLYALRS